MKKGYDAAIIGPPRRGKYIIANSRRRLSGGAARSQVVRIHSGDLNLRRVTTSTTASSPGNSRIRASDAGRDNAHKWWGRDTSTGAESGSAWLSAADGGAMAPFAWVAFIQCTKRHNKRSSLCKLKLLSVNKL